ncbi:MAG: histidine phosphatase family protein [Rhodoferax sp.]|nr:histidine phosphatase family protein [Rhodoferax sp.]
MGTLYLVRHGQASFGAQDYDQLSELGAKQSVRLGQYLAGKGLTFDAALCGTLRRQIGTCDGILRGGGYPLEARHWPGLNEFDSHAIIATVHPHPLEKTDSPERYREHFRLLRDGLRQWMNGVVSPKGMPPYQEFRQGVVEVLDHIRKTYQGNVLLVSSGGPISTAVGHVLATSPETTIELNLRIRNSSVTEFEFNPKRHTLVTYNTLPHLDTPELASWITYS